MSESTPPPRQSAADPASVGPAPDDDPPGPALRPVWTVRGHLAAFATALVAPLVLFLALLLWQVATAEQARLEQEGAETAQAIAVAIDRDVTDLRASLDVLSLSTSLQTGDLEAFHRQVAEFFRRQGIVTVLTELPSRRQLVNARLPWGAPLPVSNLPFGPTETEGEATFVTDLFEGGVAQEPLFAVARPVRRAGEAAPAYMLNLSLSPARFGRLLAEVDMPATYTAAIVDRAGLIMARSRNGAEWVGKPAAPDLLQNATGTSGSWSGATLEGVPVVAHYARSRLTGFRAAAGIGTADLRAPLLRSLSLFAAVGVTIAALSAGLGLHFGARIARPIRALARQAALLGRGEAAPPLASGLREADEVGRELLDAAETRLRREAELREANDEVQRFAYIVSHDLRSPLVNIMGFTTELEALRQDAFGRLEALRGDVADLAERGVDRRLAEDFDEAIAFIKTSTGKMDRLIAAILRLSREGRREFRPERIDMTALLAGIRDGVAHQADTAGATVSVTPLPPLVGDRLAVEQIFSNLVDNAVKYLRPGVPGEIRISGREEGPSALYEVRDNGRGIDPRDRERVFDLFRRAGVQDRPGEGIGLAHVRALVRRVGGAIALTSEPGQGSVFTVRLPRRWSVDGRKDAG